MLQKAQSRKKYPSDLTDEQWTIMVPLIVAAQEHPELGSQTSVYFNPQ
jgi:hypothetical protein